MIAKPETLLAIRAMADANAMQTIVDENLVNDENVWELLRTAYLRGADAGYAAALAEQRKP